jgi:hypothetical protein
MCWFAVWTSRKQTGQRRRHQDSTVFVAALGRAGLLRRDRRRADLVGTVWLLASPETFIQVDDGLGWSLDRYERWIEQTMADALLEARVV